MVIPWSSGVRSNVLGMIKALVNFPQGTILNKAFNNNRNVRYSYGVAKSIGRHIMSSNRRILQGGESPLGHCVGTILVESASGQAAAGKEMGIATQRTLYMGHSPGP